MAKKFKFKKSEEKLYDIPKRKKMSTAQKKWTVKKVFKKTGQIIFGVTCGILATEVVTGAAASACADVEMANKYYRYKTGKDDFEMKVVTQKKGFFRKEKSTKITCRQNPFTGKIEEVKVVKK